MMLYCAIFMVSQVPCKIVANQLLNCAERGECFAGSSR